MTRRTLRFAVLFLAVAVGAAAQQRQGPPPEMRALLDAVVAAVNGGSADAWNAFVEARFAPALAQKITRQQRDQMYQQIAADFGTIALNR